MPLNARAQHEQDARERRAVGRPRPSAFRLRPRGWQQRLHRRPKVIGNKERHRVQTRSGRFCPKLLGPGLCRRSLRAHLKLDARHRSCWLLGGQHCRRQCDPAPRPQSRCGLVGRHRNGWFDQLDCRAAWLPVDARPRPGSLLAAAVALRPGMVRPAGADKGQQRHPTLWPLPRAGDRICGADAHPRRVRLALPVLPHRQFGLFHRCAALRGGAEVRSRGAPRCAARAAETAQPGLGGSRRPAVPARRVQLCHPGHAVLGRHAVAAARRAIARVCRAAASLRQCAALRDGGAARRPDVHPRRQGRQARADRIVGHAGRRIAPAAVSVRERQPCQARPHRPRSGLPRQQLLARHLVHPSVNGEAAGRRPGSWDRERPGCRRRRDHRGFPRWNAQRLHRVLHAGLHGARRPRRARKPCSPSLQSPQRKGINNWRRTRTNRPGNAGGGCSGSSPPTTRDASSPPMVRSTAFFTSADTARSPPGPRLCETGQRRPVLLKRHDRRASRPWRKACRIHNSST